MRSFVQRSSTFVAVLAVSAVALAVPPPIGEPGIMHGFVEPCVMSNVVERHLECEPCKVASANPGACGARLGARGFTKKCRTHGDHAGWEEIWCKPREPEKPSRAGTLWVVLGVAGTLAAMGLFLRVITRPPSK